jgi:exosome complex RNA-binding protein Rrp4
LERYQDRSIRMGTLAAPGDAVQALPDAGLVKIGHAVTQHGTELRSTVFGRHTDSQGIVSVTYGSKRYHAVVGDRVIGVVRGVCCDLHPLQCNCSCDALATKVMLQVHREAISPATSSLPRILLQGVLQKSSGSRSRRRRQRRYHCCHSKAPRRRTGLSWSTAPLFLP